METKDITVNITLNGEVDVEKIAEAVRKEIERVGFKVEVSPEEAKLKVGDYAKVVDGGGCFELGEILQLIEIDDEDNTVPYRLKTLDGRTDWAKASRVIRATEAEVAEAIELARWTKIGRKPNEFMKGDIVRVVKVDGGIGNGHPYGVIGEVQKDATPISGGSGNPGVLYNGIGLLCNCELITPVEARFDLA